MKKKQTKWIGWKKPWKKYATMTALLLAASPGIEAQSYISWTEAEQSANLVHYNIAISDNSAGPWTNFVTAPIGTTNTIGMSIPNHVWVSIKSQAVWNNWYYQTNPPPVFWDTNPPAIVPVQNVQPHYAPPATNTMALVGPYAGGYYIRPVDTNYGLLLIHQREFPIAAFADTNGHVFAWRYESLYALTNQ